MSPRLCIRTKVGGKFAYTPQSSTAQLFFANQHLGASYAVLNFMLRPIPYCAAHAQRPRVVLLLPLLLSLSMLSESRQIEKIIFHRGDLVRAGATS